MTEKSGVKLTETVFNNGFARKEITVGDKALGGLIGAPYASNTSSSNNIILPPSCFAAWRNALFQRVRSFGINVCTAIVGSCCT